MRKTHLPVCLLAVLLLFCGCGESYDAKESTVFVSRDGSVTEVSVERMDESYYSETELETFITEAIEAFDESTGEVKQTGYELNDGVAKLTLNYTDWKTYTEFNRRILYVGTVVKAQAEGFTFDVSFLDGKTGNAASAEDALSTPERKIVILEKVTDTLVRVPGKLLYISSDCEIEDKNTARVHKSQSDSVTEYAYIIYR